MMFQEVNFRHLSSCLSCGFPDCLSKQFSPWCVSIRYYNLDAYHRHEIEKEIKKGKKKVQKEERTVFNDEEQRRYSF